MRKAKCKRTYIVCYLLCKKEGRSENIYICLSLQKKHKKDKSGNIKVGYLQEVGGNKAEEIWWE